MVDVDDIVDFIKDKLKIGKYKGDHRNLNVNNVAANAHHKFCGNSIATAKYNLITFLPKNIIEQFMRIANVYFLIVSILQLTTGLSPTGRFGTVVPLVIVMAFQALKDGVEDLKRHYSDRVVNTSKTRVIRNGVLTEVKWRDIKVGEICQVLRDEFFPADLIAIASSEPQGILYVETAQLDGETNLKIQNSLHHTHLKTTVEQLKDFQATITCDHPNEVLSTFKGKIQIEGEHKEYPLNAKQQLLRGACLKNTSFVWGIVVYTGKDTKLMKNLRKPPHKRSKVEILTNYYIISLFFVLGLITAFCCIAAAIWTGLNEKRHWYMFPPVPGSYDGAGAVFGKGIITYFILFNNFIPISLYVSMELVKVFQSRLFIDKDLAMYHPPVDTSANCKTSSLNEELGQIDFIFSDKTGTLTQNKMEFLKFAVDGIEYGRGTTEIGRAAAARQGKEIKSDLPEGWTGKDGFNFYDERILDNAWAQQNNNQSLFEFFMLLAVCHTVIPEPDKKDPTKINYQAASPDEGALVKAAKALGFNFCARTHDGITVNVAGKDYLFTILNVLEFNSTRKRFSVIVRTPDGRITLLTKGADSVILPRMKHGIHNDATNELLKKFAAEGLRTLICAKADLSEEQWSTWNREVFEPANISLDDKENKLMSAAEKIEVNLELIGATAIEDKLQDDVPKTISTLAEAGIKIWVLTGDKQETAINIGFACAMLDNDMKIITLNEKNRDKLRRKILKEYDTALKIKQEKPDTAFGLVIDGESLNDVLPKALPTKADLQLREDERKSFENLEITFLRLCMFCKSVICCRVTPLQKSQIVKLVKDNLKGSITLAIGDGANDVSMIQAAHIGVGISGEEGLQAARAADYSFAQFRFLQRLLLVHGHYNYRRVSKMILFSFYKNAIVQLTQFWFIFFNAFSGRSLYENTANSLYNVTWTSLPIMALCIFDMDVSPQKAEMVPKLYTLGQKDYYFNLPTFLMWIANACWHSLVIFFIPYFCLEEAMMQGGRVVDSELFGLVLFTAIILVTGLKIVFETTKHNPINFLFIFVTFLIWPLFLLVYCVLVYIFPMASLIYGNGNTTFDGLYHDVRNTLKFYYWVFYDAVANPVLWATLLLTVVFALLRDIAWKSLYRMFYTQLYHVLQETKLADMKANPKLIEEIYPYIKKMKGVERKVPAVPANYKEMVEKFNSEQAQVTSDYTGYAFSQTEGGQVELLDEITKPDVPTPQTPSDNKISSPDAMTSPQSPHGSNKPLLLQ